MWPCGVCMCSSREVQVNGHSDSITASAPSPSPKPAPSDFRPSQAPELRPDPLLQKAKNNNKKRTERERTPEREPDPDAISPPFSSSLVQISHRPPLHSIPTPSATGHTLSIASCHRHTLSIAIRHRPNGGHPEAGLKVPGAGGSAAAGERATPPLSQDLRHPFLHDQAAGSHRPAPARPFNAATSRSGCRL
jgi:hypothetical protein